MFNRVVVYGLGSLGSVIAAVLANEGYDVIGKVRVAKTEKKELRIVGEEDFTVEIPITDSVLDLEKNDLVFLSVQPYQSLSAVLELKTVNPKMIVHILNGVKSHMYSFHHLKPSLIMGGGAWWSATKVDENTIVWSNKGTQFLGVLKGSEDEGRNLLKDLPNSFPFKYISEPWSDLYQKLILNLVNAIFTLTGQYYPYGLVDSDVKELTLFAIKEGLQLLDKLKINYENSLLNNYFEFLAQDSSALAKQLRKRPAIIRGDPHIVSSLRSYRKHGYSGAGELTNEVLELALNVGLDLPWNKAILEVLRSHEMRGTLPLPPNQALEEIRAVVSSN